MPSAPPPLPRLAGVAHAELDLATGVRAHVALAGAHDAPRVLALHGWPQHWWMWRELIARLGEEARIACPDLRGLGWSGWPQDGDFRKARVAEDAIATLDALGWERALLVGHDWGGVAAYLAALQAPERFTGLLVLSAGHPWQPPLRVLGNLHRFAYQLPLATPGLGAWTMRDGRYTALVLAKAAGKGFAFAPADARLYVDVMRADGPARATEGYYRSFLTRDVPALRGMVGGRRLALPARLLYGTREPLGTAFARDLERHGDDAAVELVPDAGHWLPEERPAVVAERIRSLL